MTPEEEKEKRRHISSLRHSIRLRAEARGIEFDLDTEYLHTIAPDYCPIFKMPLRWLYSDTRLAADNSPSLDRIIPDRGYVRGNVAWISNKANQIKSNATAEEIYAVAKWTEQKQREVKLGGARSPTMDDPAFTYVTRPANITVVNDEAARDRGGY